ncbi:MAG: hypothetical protein O2892_07640 [Actinomycetota bacterium]|nr:hypothetical protein [Actinomycetota bacterium]MDA2948902.1 hypothetical protein [Actinomycetota bacterium]
MSRFTIGAPRADHYGATEQLADALPAAGETVDILADNTGAGPWFYAVLDEPLKYRTSAGDEYDGAGPFTWVTDVVFRPHNPGDQPSFGMRDFPVDLAVVLDPHMRESQVVELDRIDFIAVVEIDDADHEPPAAEPTAAPPVPDLSIHEPAVAASGLAAPQPPPEVGQDGEPGGDPPPYIAPTRFPGANFPAADFPQEQVGFPAADFPQEQVGFPAADFPQEEVGFPAADFPQTGAEFIEDPTEPPPYEPPTEPRTSPRTQTPPPRATQVEELIAQAEATVDEHHPTSVASPRTVTSSPVTVEPIRPRSKGPLIAAAVAAAVLAIGIWGFAALQSRSADSDSPDAQAESPTPTTTSESVESNSRPAPPPPRPEDFAKVTRVLPPGYPPDSCRPAEATEEGGTATLACGPNEDPGGPPVGTYTVFPGRTALNAAFDRAVAASQQRICPGNIQSPGPWRRNANPQKTAGILFCGDNGPDSVIIWTDIERLLLSTVQSKPGGPNLDAMYAWWTQHS